LTKYCADRYEYYIKPGKMLVTTLKLIMLRLLVG